jgi:hypothetical protein
MSISSKRRIQMEPTSRFNSKRAGGSAFGCNDNERPPSSFLTSSDTFTLMHTNKRRKFSSISESVLMQADRFCAFQVDHLIPSFRAAETSRSPRIQPSTRRVSFSNHVTHISPPSCPLESQMHALFYTEQELLTFAWQEQVKKHALIVTTLVYEEQTQRIAQGRPFLTPSSIVALYHRIMTKSTCSEPPTFFREDGCCRREGPGTEQSRMLSDDQSSAVPKTLPPWVKHRLDNHRNTVVARQA